MADYKKAYELLKKWENRQTKRGLIVYSNISEDKGGETVLGIARKIHSSLAMWEEVDKIKKEFGLKDLVFLSKKLLENKTITDTALRLFKKDYWDKMQCDLIVSQEFAENVFLLGVNAGIRRGVKVGQKACKIKDDGIIGKNTVKAWKNAGSEEAKRFTEIEIEYYKSLVIKNSSQAKFLQGWINRANAV